MIEITASRTSVVGTTPVRRALPTRARRTVGAWCFADHMGPNHTEPAHPADIGPHPHAGLHTVTWLTAGEFVHRDSLGVEQPLRPGQLNVMTAGGGVAHAEQSSRRYTGTYEGIQLWVAQPESTRHAPAAFAHHADLPRVDLGGGSATVLVGDLHGTTGPARLDSPLVGAELRLHARSTLGLQAAFEHAVVVLDGAVTIAGTTVTPGHLAWMAPGVEEVELTAQGPTVAMVLGGEPFDEQLVMWWNFVARTRAEIDTARHDWNHDTGRFGTVDTAVARIDAPVPPWAPSQDRD
jgi:redox-sensitive bicupin YhaK (pirin superfamily)